MNKGCQRAFGAECPELKDEYLPKYIWVRDGFTLQQNLHEAKNGDQDAMSLLLWGFNNGEWGGRNPKLAFKWAEQLALQNNGFGVEVMSDYYWRGIGVKRDVSKALEWYKRYVAQGGFLPILT